MPAIAIPGASIPTHPNYFARAQGIEQKLNIGLLGNGALQQQLPLSSNWSLGEAGKYESHPSDRYRLLQASTWSSVDNSTPGFPYGSQANQLLPVPNGWRNGDWLCSCGFHNYSSRAQVLPNRTLNTVLSIYEKTLFCGGFMWMYICSCSAKNAMLLHLQLHHLLLSAPL